MNFDPGKGQVSPNTAQPSPTTSAAAVSPVDLAAFKSRAMALNTYYPAGAACPSSLTGPAVYVEDFTGCGGAAANSEAAPGALYIARGTFSLGGNSVFYGLLYMGNLQGSSGAVVTIGGTALIQGTVAIDGPGGLVAGSSKANVIFDERVFDAFQGNARAVRTPSTWRELPRGQ